MANIEIVTSAERWHGVSNQWDALVRAARASIFQTFTYLSCQWEYRNPDADSINTQLAIFLIWELDSLIGVAPFFLKRRFRWSVEVERSLHLAHGGTANHNAFTALPAKEVLVGTLVAQEVLQQRFADSIYLGGVSEDSVAIDAFLATLQQQQATVDEVGREERYVTLLPAFFDDFLAGLNHADRRKHRRATEQCEQLGVTVEVASGSAATIDAAMVALLALHCERWNAVGVATPLSAPAFQRRVRAEAQRFHEQGWLHLALLKHRSSVIAGEFTNFYPPTGTSYGGVSARDLGWNEFAPGRFLQLTCLRHMIEAGLRRRDHGWGAQEYKTLYRPFVTYHDRRVRVTLPSRFLRPVGRTLRGLRKIRRWASVLAIVGS